MRLKFFAVFASVLLLLGSIPQVRAQSSLTTWMDASGLAGSCLAVQTENSQTIASGYYYCSQQPTSFSSPYCYDPQNGICYGSLYLPDLTLEGITTTWGAPFNVVKDSNGRVTNYSRTDLLVENQGGNGPVTWSGSITQSFHVSYGSYNLRCRCYPSTTTALAGGSGTLTGQ